ncbi:hypothetical protein D3C81_273950 [compost metagenome]
MVSLHARIHHSYWNSIASTRQVPSLAGFNDGEIPLIGGKEHIVRSYIKCHIFADSIVG